MISHPRAKFTPLNFLNKRTTGETWQAGHPLYIDRKIAHQIEIFAMWTTSGLCDMISSQCDLVGGWWFNNLKLDGGQWSVIVPIGDQSFHSNWLVVGIFIDQWSVAHLVRWLLIFLVSNDPYSNFSNFV